MASISVFGYGQIDMALFISEFSLPSLWVQDRASKQETDTQCIHHSGSFFRIVNSSTGACGTALIHNNCQGLLYIVLTMLSPLMIVKPGLCCWWASRLCTLINSQIYNDLVTFCPFQTSISKYSHDCQALWSWILLHNSNDKLANYYLLQSAAVKALPRLFTLHSS